MTDLGLYKQLGRSYVDLMHEALDECNTKLKNGYIKLINRGNDNIDIRFYLSRFDIPKTPRGQIFELKDGELI